MKVWLVSSGEYSSYTVNAIFTSPKLAQAYMDNFPSTCRHGGYNGLEEFELDPLVEEVKNGWKAFYVSMDKAGNCSVNDALSLNEELGFRGPYMIKGEIKIALSGVVIAKDQMHAAKMINERRVQLIASGEWDIAEEIKLGDPRRPAPGA
jgi:hypothetical protein